MLYSLQETFSDGQAFTATALSTNIIDLLPPDAGATNAGTTGGPSANTIRDIGTGAPLYLHILITTAVGTASGDTSTVFTLESSAATAITASTTHWTSATFATNVSLAVGTWVAKGIALPADAYLRYLAIRATISTQNWNAGKVQAWLSSNRYSDRYYQGGWTTGVN